MNSMREYSNISQNDAWAKHIKKLSQSRDNAQFPAPSTGSHTRQNHSLLKQSKWGR